MLRKILPFVLVFFMLAASGCATGAARKGHRNMADPLGPWSDADTRFVAQEMVEACTAGAWVGRFNKARGQDPLVSVGNVTGRTDGHTDAGVFVEGLQMALINSGRVKFVAAAAGQPQGADGRMDYLLQGGINYAVDGSRGQRAFTFQADIEIIDPVTREKVWAGQKKVRKVIKGPRYSL